jgi:hypothetical protein
MARLRWMVMFLVFGSVAYGQTFRSQITGLVVDSQGAVIANAAVQLLNPATGITQPGKSNGAGEFTFPELQPGIYQVTVSLPGFETTKIGNIDAAVSKVANVKVVLSVGSESRVVDIVANGVEVETTSSALVSVVDSKAVQDEPINGRDFTKMVRFTAGVVGSGYVNGNSHVNFQVDGVDNVDAWLGIVASNQGGIAGVPGGLIPIEAIDQFSVQSNGEADQGRNAGANQNMVMKSGTNKIHGDVFFYNRNEFFAAITPVQAVGSRKAPIRNNQFGFTLGGPVVIPHLYNGRDKTFLFFAGEIQLASAGNSINTTVVNDAWVGSNAQNGGLPSVASQFVANYSAAIQTAAGVNKTTYATPNPVTSALYTNIFRTSANPATGATTNNYLVTAPNQYNSYNGVIKLDHHFSEKETISARYIGTTGKQTAYIGSAYASMYQTAPMHIHNGSIIQTSILSPRMLNQLTLGINYFLQTFNDASQSYYPSVNDGLNLGAQPPNIADGSPSVSVTGFNQIGETQPSGRTDVTGQINDSFRWTLGKHSLKIGGEYRHTNANVISLGSSRGTFSFTGTGGPWSGSSAVFTPTVTPDCYAADTAHEAPSKTGTYTSTQVAQCAAQHCYAIGGQSYLNQATATSGTAAAAYGETCISQVLSAADLLLGVTPSALGSSSLRVGVGTRIYLINQEDFWLQDDFRVTQQLSFNYGLRWSLPGVVSDAQNDLTSWAPTGNGQGAYVQPIYHQYYKALAPRLGFAFSPYPDGKTSLRGAWGIIYDVPSMSSQVASSAGNPAGPDPSYVGTTNSFVFASGVNPFLSATGGAKPPAVLPANGVNQNYRIAYQENYSLGMEQQLSKSTLLSVGYIGSEGRRLPVTYDYNQANGCTTAACGVYTRPFDAAGAGAPCTAAPATLSCIYFTGQVVGSGSPFGAVHELQSAGISNFNSLNISLRQSAWKGISGNVNYIWGKKMDDGTAPTNNLNNSGSCLSCVNGAFPDGVVGPGIKMDYGPGAGDTRHTFDGFISYSFPKFHFVPKLSQGWQVNALYSFYTGGVLNPSLSTSPEYSLQGESGDRPSINPGQCVSGNCSKNPYMKKQVFTTATGSRIYITQNATIVQSATTKSITSSSNTFDYPIHGVTTPNYNPTNNPSSGTNTYQVYGNVRRDTLNGTAFGDVDFSLFKYTPITEKVKSEFRVEIFNLFNQSNLASPGVSVNGSTFGQITNTAQASSNPGMGYGEPFNIQFALKILF